MLATAPTGESLEIRAKRKYCPYLGWSNIDGLCFRRFEVLENAESSMQDTCHALHCSSIVAKYENYLVLSEVLNFAARGRGTWPRPRATSSAGPASTGSTPRRGTRSPAPSPGRSGKEILLLRQMLKFSMHKRADYLVRTKIPAQHFFLRREGQASPHFRVHNLIQFI